MDTCPLEFFHTSLKSNALRSKPKAVQQFNQFPRGREHMFMISKEINAVWKDVMKSHKNSPTYFN